MEINLNFKSGILGLVLILAGFGGSQLLTSDQIDHAYVCTVDTRLALCDRLSSTAKTCYYLGENNEERSAVCRNGLWIKLTEYAKEHGIDPKSFLYSYVDATKDSILSPPAGEQYLCPPVNNCTRIK